MLDDSSGRPIVAQLRPPAFETNVYLKIVVRTEGEHLVAQHNIGRYFTEAQLARHPEDCPVLYSDPNKEGSLYLGKYKPNIPP